MNNFFTLAAFQSLLGDLFSCNCVLAKVKRFAFNISPKLRVPTPLEHSSAIMNCQSRATLHVTKTITFSRDFKANNCKANQNLTLNFYLQISTITHLGPENNPPNTSDFAIFEPSRIVVSSTPPFTSWANLFICSTISIFDQCCPCHGRDPT